MAIEVKMPDLGDGIESADVMSLFVSVGDTVEKDQDLIEIETDKATTEIQASAAGTITKISVAVGDTVAIGAVIVELEASDAAAQAAPAAVEPPVVAEPTVPPAEPEPPKVEAAPVVPAPTPVAAPKPVVVETPPVKTEEPLVAAVSVPVAESTGDFVHADIDSVPAGPTIRRFAREVGIDLRRVAGTGSNGRVTREDVLRTVREHGQSSSANETTAPAVKAPAAPATTKSAKPAVGEPGQDKFGPIRVQKMPKIRQTIAKHMSKSWTTAPRVTNFDDADVTALEELRQQSKADYAAVGVKLTSMPFLIKAVALSLEAHPDLNATIDVEKKEIVYKDYVNVGIAVDSERGLVVPNFRNTNEMSIPDIARTLQQVAADVRSNNFSMDQLQGGTFTISNLGAIGGTYSTPIINVPEVAILLVGRSRMMPVVVDGEIVPRLMMPMSLSYDHRMVDGAAAARFLNEIIGYLEAPSRLLMAP
ncbi:MAG: pyruvate dehydrogenase [Blastopirellula sp.]|nr:MAG: pyruvate dehydrogenase [Blastopirellula sp.]